MLAHADVEEAVGVGYSDARSREGVLDDGVEGACIADFPDGLQGCREIVAVAVEDRRIGADVRAPSWSITVGP